MLNRAPIRWTHLVLVALASLFGSVSVAAADCKITCNGATDNKGDCGKGYSCFCWCNGANQPECHCQANGKYPAAMLFPGTNFSLVTSVGAGGTADILSRGLAQSIRDRHNVITLVVNGTSASVNSAESTLNGALVLSSLTVQIVGKTNAGKEVLNRLVPVAILAKTPLVVVADRALTSEQLISRLGAAKHRVLLSEAGGASERAIATLERMLSTQIARVVSNVAEMGQPGKAFDATTIGIVPLKAALDLSSSGRGVVVASLAPSLTQSDPNLRPLQGPGFDGAEFYLWHGVFASSQCAPNSVEGLRGVIDQYQGTREFRELCNKLGCVAGTEPPSMMKLILRQDLTF